MTSEPMGESYIAQAADPLSEARANHAAGKHHWAVRRAQECVELCLKGILRLAGVEHPKDHEPAPALRKVAGVLPHWLRERLEEIEDLSRWLADMRGPAFYGDEKAGIGAPALISAEHGRRAVEGAQTVLALTQRFLAEWRRASQTLEDGQRGDA